MSARWARATSMRNLPTVALGSAARLLFLFAALAIPTLVAPWFVPVRASRTLSYMQGFSNVALWMLVVGLLMTPTILIMRSRFGPMLAPSHVRLSAIHDKSVERVWSWGFGSYVAFSAFLLILSLNLAGYFDAEYFLIRAALIAAGKSPYADFEYAYGPLLLYPLVGLQHVGLPAGASLAALVLLQSAIGYLSIYVLLKWLMEERAARYMLACILVATTPSLLVGGENYTFFRFATVAVIACAVLRRVSGSQAVVGALLSGPLFLLAWSISPEIAVAVGAAFGLVCAVSSGRPIPTFVLALTSIGTSLAVTPMVLESYITLIEFAGGGKNFPAYPAIHILFFIGSVFAASLHIATKQIRTHPVDWFLFIYSTLLIPAALGRCDPLHVVFNGFGFFILAGKYLLENRLRWVSFTRFSLAYAWIFLVTWVPVYAVFVAPGMEARLTLASATAAKWIAGEVPFDVTAAAAEIKKGHALHIDGLKTSNGELFILPAVSSRPEDTSLATYYVAFENTASSRAIGKLMDQIRGKRLLIEPKGIEALCKPRGTELASLLFLFPVGMFESRNDDRIVVQEFCEALRSAAVLATHGTFVELRLTSQRPIPR